MSLTLEQQRLINMYVTQYNQTNAHIDHLLNMLDDIRNNIHINLVGNNNYPRQNQFNRSRHTSQTPNTTSNYLNTYIKWKHVSFVIKNFQENLL
jgi:hypothetical protein